LENNVWGDAKLWGEGDRRRENAAGNEVGIGDECCLWTAEAKLEDLVAWDLNNVAEKRQARQGRASKQWTRINRMSVQGSRRYDKAVAPNDRTNDVIILSSSSWSPSFIVKLQQYVERLQAAAGRQIEAVKKKQLVEKGRR
jgi:hypothetical protein